MSTDALQHWCAPRVILVATNLADTPALVVQAISQARSCGARILLVHVIRRGSLRASLDPKPAALITSSRFATAWEVLDRTSTMIEWQGVTCEPLVLEGDPITEIPALAKAREVDRVLVATRSTRGLGRLMEGSVAEALMTAADVPVCVIGPGVTARPFFGLCGGWVVLPLSLHHNQLFYVQFACELARRRDSGVVLLHVLETSAMDEAGRTAARMRARIQLESLLATPLDCRAEISVREGEIAHAIRAEGVCPDRDLIVMGAPSASLFSRLLGISLIQRVIATARCPVLLVRPPLAAESRAADAESESVEPAGHSSEGLAAMEGSESIT